MTRLTPAMRAALRHGSRKGGVHIGLAADADGNPPPDKRVTKPVARVLVEQGLARQDRNRLNILPAGRAALNAPQPHVPVFFRNDRHDLTTRPEFAVRGEPEVMTSTPVADREAEIRRLAAQDPRTEARLRADRARRVA